MAKNFTAAMLQKVEILRQITGGAPFVVRRLNSDVYRRLDYSSRSGLTNFISTLADGTSVCGRQLTRIRYGHYTWLNSSQGGEAEPAKQDSSP